MKDESLVHASNVENTLHSVHGLRAALDHLIDEQVQPLLIQCSTHSDTDGPNCGIVLVTAVVRVEKRGIEFQRALQGERSNVANVRQWQGALAVQQIQRY